jgi:hypothetical protein
MRRFLLPPSPLSPIFSFAGLLPPTAAVTVPSAELPPV